MKRLFALLSCLVSFACTPQTLSPSRFTEEFSKAVRLASPSTRVAVKSDLEVLLTNSAGKDSTVFLDNAYKEYLQDNYGIDGVIQRYVASYLDVRYDEVAIDRSLIVPVIKDRQWLSDISQSLQNSGKNQPLEHVVEDLNERLVIVYAEDSPNSIRYLIPKNLEEIGLSKAELRKLSIENLKRVLPDIELHKGPLVSMITAGGSFEASLLLFDDLWNGDSIKVEGDLVVAIPSRDLLLVTGSKTPGGIAKLRELATRSLQKASYHLTDELFVYQNGQFVKLEGL